MRAFQSAILPCSGVDLVAPRGQFTGRCAVLVIGLAAIVLSGCGGPSRDELPQTVAIASVDPVSSAHPLQQGTQAKLTLSSFYGQFSTSGTHVVFTLNGSEAGSAPVTGQQATSAQNGTDGVVLSFTIPNLSSTAAAQFGIAVSGKTTRGGNISTKSPFTATIYPLATISSITPAVVHAGQQGIIAIQAKNANFAQGTTAASFGAGISVGGKASGAAGPVTVNSPTTATVSVSVDPAAALGTRTVSVATDDQTASIANVITVAAAQMPPTAAPGGPYTGFAGLAIAFTGAASIDPSGLALAYAWDFGDGTQGTGVSPSHTYAKAGAYTVKLTVTDSAGLSTTANTTATIVALGVPVPNTGGPYSGQTGQSISFDASASTDPNNSALTYAWNFGDGSQASGVKAAHSYAKAGKYIVSLVLTDTYSKTATATTTATITNPAQPPVAKPGGPYTGIAGQAIVFNGSGSTDPNGLELTYAWDFGDGSVSNQATPSHSYGSTGSYTVKLTVSDSSGLSGSASTTATVTASNVLTANPGGPYTGVVGAAVLFNGAGSHDPKNETLTYAWDFGDGSQGSGATPTHVFTQAATDTVTLTVTNTDKATATAATTATISDVLAAVLNGPYTGNIKQVLSFDGLSSTGPSNDPLNYAWSFGDGATAVGSTVTHAYSKAGTFAVQLTVKDTVTSATVSATSSAVITQPIAVAISSPSQGALFNTSSINVTGTVSEAAATVQVNGVAAVVNGGNFTAASVPIREGVNLITATATDAKGNSGTASTSVTVDMTPPTVSVFLPKDGSTVTTQQITVTGMVTDIVTGTVNANDVTVTINGQSATVANRSFALAGFLLVPGLNTLSVHATDKAGNQSTSVVHVLLASAAAQQHAVILSGDGQSGVINSVLPEPLVAQLVAANGAPVPNRAITFTVTASDGILKSLPQQGQALTLVTDANGKASVLFQLGSRAGLGLNQVSVTSPGFLGQAVFSASTTAGPPAFIHEFMGNNQRGLLGQPLAGAFQTIVQDAGGNPIAGVPVNFTVGTGDGTVGGNAAATVNTDADGRALATLTLGQQEGINNYTVGADFAGDPNTGVIFYASGFSQGNPASTQVSGLVLDNTGKPVPSATVSLQNTNLRTTTDTNGHFSIAPAPLGTVTLLVDGSTTTLAETLPTLTFVLQSLPGQNNTLNMPVYLPIIDTNNAQTVGGAQPVTLTMTNLPGVSLTIAPNSVTFQDGSHIGQMSLSQVKSDLIPMPPPNGIQPDFAWTLQPAGTRFSVPAAIAIPNTKALPPGQVQEFYQYDHDLEQFVSVGTLRVSPDGSVLNSDPGFGVTKAGWSSPGSNPPPGTCPQTCDDGNDCTDDGRAPNCQCTHTNNNGKCGLKTSGKSDCQNPGQCKNGRCSSTPRKSGTCDDGDVCTTNDMCNKSGICVGTPKPDTDLPAGALIGQIQAGLTSIAGPLQNAFAASLPGGASISVQVTPALNVKSRCCSTQNGKMTPLVSGAFKGQIAVTSPRAVAGVNMLDFQLGPYVQAQVSVNPNVGVTYNGCDMPGKSTVCFSGGASVTGAIEGGLIAVITNPVDQKDLFSVKGAIQASVTGSYWADCQAQHIQFSIDPVILKSQWTTPGGSGFEYDYPITPAYPFAGATFPLPSIQ